MSETAERILRDILRGNEEIVRALDMKTEIAMLCFVLSVEAAHSLGDLGGLRTTRPLLSGLLFAMFIAAVVAYMLVLFPAHNPGLKGRSAGSGERDTQRTAYFVPDPRAVPPEELVRVAASADYAHDLAEELLKLAFIRNSKRRRFVAALCITLAFYAILLVGRFAE